MENKNIKYVIIAVAVFAIGILVGFELNTNAISSIQGFLYKGFADATSLNSTDSNASDSNASDSNASDSNASASDATFYDDYIV